MYYIYFLYDPHNLEVRYVGVTNNPTRRRYKHRATPDKNAKTHRDNWIRSLINSGTRPEMRVVEEVENTEWQEAERRWIKETYDAGFDLTNSTSGGDGVRDYIPSPEQLIRLKTQNRDRIRSDEFKAKISITTKGRIPWAAIEAARVKPKVSCVSCKREISVSNFIRHYKFKHDMRTGEG